jgi:hypothetical protein
MLKSTYRPASSTAEAPLPEGWTEHTAPSGHKYYYNTSTQKSTYSRPAPDELQIDFNATQPDYEIKASLTAQDEFARNNAPPNTGPSNNFHNQRHDPQPANFGAGPSHQDRLRRRGHGGDRPKSKKPIANCEPWLLVTTRFGRRFVHNTETKQSLWKFPSDVMMAVIEMDRVEWEAKRAKEGVSQEVERPEARGIGAGGEEGEAGDGKGHLEREGEGEGEDSDEYEEVEVTDDEAEDDGEAVKRLRLDSEPNVGGPVEYDEDDIEWQLAQMDAYNDEDGDAFPDDGILDTAEEDDERPGGGAGEDEGLPITKEDNIALFRSLLDDFHISPYSTFDKILENAQLIDDERYISLPNMHSRREVFTAWSRDRVAEIKEKEREGEQAQQTQDPKVEYLRFLSEHASTKLFWPEFKRKHRKEGIMTSYELGDKEREKMYREFVAKLKIPEADRRRELLGLFKGAGLQRGLKASEMPETVLKDVRYWAVIKKRREDIVEDFLATL